MSTKKASTKNCVSGQTWDDQGSEAESQSGESSTTADFSQISTRSMTGILVFSITKLQKYHKIGSISRRSKALGTLDIKRGAHEHQIDHL